MAKTKAECCCEIGTAVHYVVNFSKLTGVWMRPAIVIRMDEHGTASLAVFTDSPDEISEEHGNESTHPVAHVTGVKHCPKGTPGTWHLPSEMAETKVRPLSSDHSHR